MSFNDSETVGSEEAFWSNALFNKQKQQTEQMRSVLLSCNETDTFSVQSTMRKILALRVYHQITRIIRYTEEMDKIEQKLYQVIDVTLENMDYVNVNENTQSCLTTLMHMQQKLQQSMIDSQKLLDPYLNMDTLSYVEVPSETVEDNNVVAGRVLDQDSRQRLREGAQAALTVLQGTAKENSSSRMEA